MENYIVFALAFAASAAAPGPDIAALVARTLSTGARSSLAILIGIISGKLILFTCALMGLAVLIQTLGPLFMVIKLAGALYLIWLGVKTWMRAGHSSLAPDNKARSFIQDLFLGFAMALANPIAILFYIALLPNVMDMTDFTLQQAILSGAIISILMFLIGGTYILFAGAARKLFTNPRAKRRLDQGSGFALVSTGVFVASR